MQNALQGGLKIAFIGGGNMANALIGGLAGKLTAGANIHVVDINQDALQKLQSGFGVTTASEIDQQVAGADVIVLAVKPQQMKEVIATLRPQLRQQLLLSIAAGIRAADLKKFRNVHL